MRKYLWAALPVALLACAPAQASVFSDDLAKCLVAKTTAADKSNLVQWIFGVLSVHPKVTALAKVTSEQRAESARTVGKLFERLLTADCRAETVAALKADGLPVVMTSFELLGKVAMREFMQDPAVLAEMGALEAGADKAKLQALFREAGIPVRD